MIILIGAGAALLLAAVLLGLSFARSTTREFTRPLGIFAIVLAAALFILYAVQ